MDMSNTSSQSRLQTKDILDVLKMQHHLMSFTRQKSPSQSMQSLGS
jgi:hypothetical protein